MSLRQAKGDFIVRNSLIPFGFDKNNEQRHLQDEFPRIWLGLIGFAMPSFQ